MVEKDVSGRENCPDMLICDYTYNHLNDGIRKTINYRNIFPIDKVCSWDKIGIFRPHQYLVMHALIYRTDVLRNSKVVLPENTFYVDNIFVFQPLPYVKTMYYLDVNFYRYFIGREDQSVNEKVMIGRIDQQIRVNKLMIDYFVECKAVPSGKLRIT